MGATTKAQQVGRNEWAQQRKPVKSGATNMNLDQWTIKAQEALQAAQTEARERNHQALTPLHLLDGVLKD
ncbi:hypothetical protein KKB28_06930, partial [bacterium]|nr:hypothetical protein [bacterium]